MKMGKKGYNWKARKVQDVEIDDSTTRKITVDIEHRDDGYDHCNALVLPNEKRKIKRKEKSITATRLLSKKRRKQLEKTVERKNKKARRATLLEELAKVQAPEGELKQYVSLTSIQTKGLKRSFQELSRSNANSEASSSGNNEIAINTVRGGNKKRLALLEEEKSKTASTDPNVVGLDEESSESDSDANDEENESIKSKEKFPDPCSPLQSTNEDHLGEKIVNSTTDEDSNIPLKVLPVKETRKSLTIRDEDRKPAIFVPLNRKPEIQEARLKLPILAEEQTIVETINENPVVIITGETGSGKTTQVPQFLYEAGYARNKVIGITEPRRVAAMSMSKRVAEEMNLTGKEVSYLIRFEGNVTSDTKIKFMTDGVLLKEIQSDFLLTKYSIIILDEAHERSVYTDILIGLLSRIVPLRNKRKDPLKLIIMSATLRVEDFVDNPKLFENKPPVLTVKTRQFPVTVHFNKRTSADYVKDALRKAAKIHAQLPEGGILIFLTGQREVNSVVRKLRKIFPFRRKKLILKKKPNEENNDEATRDGDDGDSSDSHTEFYDQKVIKLLKRRRKKRIQLPRVDLDEYSATPSNDTPDDLLDIKGSGEDSDIDDSESDDNEILDLNGLSCSHPLWVLPLYSLLPGCEQAKVFEPVPEGCRLCVVSTNVAETSLTIPNIRYVIDCGRTKTRLYDQTTGVTTFRVCYASKAAANQRAGRSNRSGPGHCYRLYSSAVFNDQFEQFAEPEIRRKPVDDLLLQMKVMNIDKVVNFPFPSPPDVMQLKSAEKRLCMLGALQSSNLPSWEDEYCAKVTPLGRTIAAFPVAPRYGKMLALSQQQNLLRYTVSLVAALSVQELLVEVQTENNSNKNKWIQTRRAWAGTGNSLLLGDPMVLIRAVGAAEYEGSRGRLNEFCEEHGLRYKAVIEIRKLRQQLTNEILLNVTDLDLAINPDTPPPTDREAKLLRQIVLAGAVDRVARKLSPDEIKEDRQKTKWKHAYKTMEMEDPVFIHSSSVLRKTNPEWIVYQEIYETNKIYMRGVTAIDPEWLPKFASSLCRLGDPLVLPPPRYIVETGKVVCHMAGTFGRAGWELPEMELDHPTNVEGVRWFARFFLEGQVCPKLQRFVPSLLSTPSSINKSWAKLLPRTEAITQALLSKGIMTRDRLLEVWSDDKTFLLSAYQKWLPESAHAEVALLWPPT